VDVVTEVHGQWRGAKAEWDHDKWCFKPIKPVLIDKQWLRGWWQAEDIFQRRNKRKGVTYTGD
jgi:hypothetical protein